MAFSHTTALEREGQRFDLLVVVAGSCPQARLLCAWNGSGAVSHAALAAVLRLEEVSAGERLTAFSFASFANREHHAWPGTPVAAARAGLSRSQYLAARDGLAPVPSRHR
ncbi:MAG: hypothetical protein WAU75_08180 [Solirubrobacteraceae bacterium]